MYASPPGLTGVWVHDHKVAAVGIRAHECACSYCTICFFASTQQCALTHTVPLCRWVTYHGVAINVSPNLSHFDYIVPCGISHLPVGSIEQLASDGFCAPHLASLSASALMERVFALVLEAFERNFGVTIERAGVEDLVNGNEDSIVHWCT